MTNNNIMRFALDTFSRAWKANCFRIARTTPAQGPAQGPHKAVQTGLPILILKKSQARRPWTWHFTLT